MNNFYDVFHVYDNDDNYLYNVAVSDLSDFSRWKEELNFNSQFFDRFLMEEEEFEEELQEGIFKIKKFI